MSLRINHNITAMNSHRQMLTNDTALGKSLEKLSSGLKINRAADGPASLIISEQMRAQISGLNQAVDNSETAIGMVQTTEAALTEVSNLLVKMRQLSIHAANEGANDQSMLEADQLELENALNTIDRITTNSQFGVKKLLDGSQGANGVGIGAGLEFVGASPETRSSPVEGYEVRVTQLGTQASVKGTVALTQEMVDGGEEFTVSEGGKTVSFVAQQGDSVAQTIGKLHDEIKQNGLALRLVVHEDGTFEIKHEKFGSAYSFAVASSSEGVLSQQSRVMEQATPGQDIRGFIGGEVTTGKGQVLTGADGTRVQGLKIRYTGDILTEEDAGEGASAAGRIAVYQNSPLFQVGPNAGQTVSVSLVNTNTRVLGRGVANVSRFQSLRDLDLRSAQSAGDSQRLIDRAIDEINVTRANLGAFQKNTLESNLRQLRINTEELTNAESVIRDADMAKEVTEYTRNSIMMQSASAMLAQANQTPKTVLSLLG
ncbi:MAG: flagellin [Candidatus Lambdaproteobacteria bacterium]|nr:flagellin [Candidatus Lambdaproteobacteria bacterium]